MSKKRRVIFASVYRHPTNTHEQLTADFEDLEAQLQHVLTRYPRTTVIIAGDLNTCLLKSPTSNTGSAPRDWLHQLVATYGLHICNQVAPTYRPTSSLLDVIITNRPELVTRTDVARCHYGGPHDFTRVSLSQNDLSVNDRTEIETRCLNQIDTVSFNSILAEADWGAVYEAADPTEKWESFLQVFIPLLDGVAPVKRVRLPRARAPPLIRETRDLLARRRAALAAGPVLRDTYRELNRQCRAAIRKDCRDSLLLEG